MTVLRLGKIERESTGSRGYEHLKKGILSGLLPPGERLLEVQVAEELGVSRSPIREASRQLKADGLVEIRPHRGRS